MPLLLAIPREPPILTCIVHTHAHTHALNYRWQEKMERKSCCKCKKVVCLCTGRQTKDEAASFESVPGNNMGLRNNMAICNDPDLKGGGGDVDGACAGAGAGADNEQTQLVSFAMTRMLGEVSA